MATYVGTSLSPSGTPLAAGAAFKLAGSVSGQTARPFGSWTVTTIADPSLIVAVRDTGTLSTNPDDVRGDALDAAQCALDVASGEGRGDATLQEAADDYVLWWPGTKGLVVREVTTIPVKAAVGAAQITVRDAQGNVVPQPVPPAPIWHESLRYYRLSQVTTDLVDSFRNLYLAIESILSFIEPMHLKSSGKPGESEKVWLARALGVAHAKVRLDSYAPNPADPINSFISDIYEGVRTSVFHAKTGRTVRLPHASADRAEIIAAAKRLTGLYAALAKEYLNIRRSGSFMFAVAFRSMFDGTFPDADVYMSDDESDLSDQSSPNPGGGTLVPMPFAPTGRDTDPFIANYLYSTDGTSLDRLPFVRRIVGMKGVDLIFGVRLDGRLTLEGVERFELLVRVRGENMQQPRAVYLT